jgi:predicted MFS family arabinose efflux permease
MIVYTITAPIIAYFADRSPRQIWVSVCAGLWSAFTALTGMAKNFYHIAVARSFIGAGEAGFTSVYPSLAAEEFKPELRARILAILGLALPLGSALGYLLGGVIGQKYGWRTAFYVLAIPGFLLALWAFVYIKDKRKITKEKGEKVKLSAYLQFFKSKSFVFLCLGEAMSTFAFGGLAAWMPTYFHRYYGFSVAQAGTHFGALIIIAGLIGTLGGGFLADFLIKYTKKAYFYTTLLGYAAALPLGLLGLLCDSPILALICFGLAMSFVFMQTGALNAAIISITSVKIRSMAFALNIFIIHALGDSISPMAIGKISQSYDLYLAIVICMTFLAPAIILTYFAARTFKGQEL